MGTTLSLQTTGQRTCSVHPMEKFGSDFLLDPKTLQSERADKSDGGESAGGCPITVGTCPQRARGGKRPVVKLCSPYPRLLSF